MVAGVGIWLVLTLAAPDTTPLPVKIWAIEAVREERETPSYDAGATEVREALQDLDFDVYHTLKTQPASLKPDEELQFTLSDRYRLILRYQGREDDQRARVVARVEMMGKQPGDPPRKIVETTLLLADQKARICGLRTEKGEMVVVLTAHVPK